METQHREDDRHDGPRSRERREQTCAQRDREARRPQPPPPRRLAGPQREAPARRETPRGFLSPVRAERRNA